MIVLSLFVLLTALINRQPLYVLFAGWLILNSPPTRAATSPALVSPVASSSRMRRRTGSPRTSKACTQPLYHL